MRYTIAIPPTSKSESHPKTEYLHTLTYYTKLTQDTVHDTLIMK